MEKTKFVCGHCNHRFEAEAKDGLECPLCFWSSSVTREEDAAASSKTSSLKAAHLPAKPFKGFSHEIWVGLFFVVITFAILGLIVVFASRFKEAFHGKSFSLSVAAKKDKTSDQAESEKQSPGALPGSLSAAQPDLNASTPEEKAVLERRLNFSTDRALSEEEKKILEHRASFSTGINENLPSQSWTLEKFQQVLKEQQDFYKVPLSRSYVHKLEKVFNENYLPANAVFEKGELLKARDLWLGALTYPIYGNDIKLHRGVVLTMLRSFINDTLSKIGAINHVLVEKETRDKETKVSGGYQALFDGIQKKDWQTVVSEITALSSLLDELENPKKQTSQAPAYPVSLMALVDDGIRATLIEQLQVPPPPMASLNTIRADIEQKVNVAESFLPVRLQEMQGKYDEGLAAVDRKDWFQAEQKFREVRFPLALFQDAQEKAGILKKLQNTQMGTDTKDAR